MDQFQDYFNDDLKKKVIALLISFAFALMGGFLFEIPNGISINKFLPSCLKIKTNPWFQNIKIPSFLGILIFGILAKNLPGGLVDNLDRDWINFIRVLAVTCLLYKIALDLNLSACKRSIRQILKLGIFPNSLETVMVGLLGILIFQIQPWLSFAMGSVAAGEATAVIVPIIVELQESYYGVSKSIPTILLAGSCLDNILSILSFNIAFSMGFKKGSYFGEAPIHILLKEILGIFLGIFSGFMVSLLFRKSNSHKPLIIFVLTQLASYFLVYFQRQYLFNAAGFISVFSFILFTSSTWAERTRHSVSKASKSLWNIMKYLLFVMIGACTDLEELDKMIVLKCLCIMIICTIVRGLVSHLCFCREQLNGHEKAFIVLTWMTKATLQAALGGEILNIARLEGHGEEREKEGTIISTLAVLYILITAPIGAMLMTNVGPKWLEKSNFEENIEKKIRQPREEEIEFEMSQHFQIEE